MLKDEEGDNLICYLFSFVVLYACGFCVLGARGK